MLLKKGDTGPKVMGLQVGLDVCRTPAPPLPFVPIPYPSIKADGEYGPKTVKAVSIIQKIAGLKVTGEADAKTLKLIAMAAKNSKAQAKEKPVVKAKFNEKQKANLASMKGKTTNLKAMQKFVDQTQKALKDWSKQSAMQDKQVQSSRDDAQLAQLNLQQAMQKQQQSLQLASSMSKRMHDTAMAIIKKVG